MTGRVGFIGLGQMGYPMAASLVAAGYQVLAVDTNPAACARLAALPGVTCLATPAEAAAADLVFTCLPSEAAVRAVYFGADGLAPSGHAGLVTVDCSTITPGLAAELGGTLSQRGIQHIDAPIFGTPDHAARGDGYFCVSGALDALPVAAGCLMAMGRAYRAVGAAGNANRIKLIQNALGYVNAVATAEALALASLSGIAPSDLVAVVKECDGIGNSTFFQRYAGLVAAGQDGGGGRLAIAAKDIHLLSIMAEGIGLDVPMMAAAQACYAEAARAGLGGHEFTEVARVVARRAGRPLFYAGEEGA